MCDTPVNAAALLSRFSPSPRLPLARFPVAEALCRLLSVQAPSSLRWSHGANTLPLLHAAHSSASHFIEADVQFDPATCQPVMSHDQSADGTQVLPFLQAAVRRSPLSPAHLPASSPVPPVGLKLDFKDSRAVTPTLLALSSLLPPPAAAAQSAINPLLWLNADVLQGPLGPAPSIDAARFIADARALFPDAVLSLGWTTGTPVGRGGEDDNAPVYSAGMVAGMVAVCEAHGVVAVTFPVRARYVEASWAVAGGLRDALEGEGRRGWSLTVWSNATDGREQPVRERQVETEWIKAHLPMARAFLDLTE